MIAALIAAAAAAAAAPEGIASLPKPLQPFAQKLPPEQQKLLLALPESSRKQLAEAVDGQFLGSVEQLKNLMSLEPSPQMVELITTDNCILCHSDPKNQKAKALFSPDPKAQKSNPLLDLREFVSDVHFRRGVSCAGCHGGAPTDESMSPEIAKRWPKEAERHADRTWIPEFCAKCHADPAYMRGFNPALPTDQLAKYRESSHGRRLLGEKDSKAAQCVSCHGVHGIRSAKSRKSTVHVQRIPETCGRCHGDAGYMAGYKTASGAPLPTNQLAEFKNSVHGKALLEKGDLGAPACNGCHGNHAAMPPKVASVSQVCRHCHASNGMLFDGSAHKKAFEAQGWPECGKCHGNHGIQKASVAMIDVGKGGLCHDCHDQYASAKKEECTATAKHFRSVLDGLQAGKRDVAPQVEHLAEMGLDVEPLAGALGELDEALVQARTRIHRFDKNAFDEAAAPATSALEKAKLLAGEARAEHGFRRRGLIGALGVMLLLGIGIALKVRGIERRRRQNP